MDVRKSENAFRTITEVAEILDLPAHVLRFWESKFKYIKPMKRGGGRRYYRPEDIHLLLGIKHLLYSEGLTIKGAQKVIQKNGVKSVVVTGASKSKKSSADTTQFEKPEVTTEEKKYFKFFDISNKKIIDDVDHEQIRNIVRKLQTVRNKIQNRYEKMVVM